MIEAISHITFIVQDLEKTSALYKEIFDAKEVYDSKNKPHSIAKEKFFIIAGQWIAVMENKEIVNRTYHHIAFKISADAIEQYLHKIQAWNLEMLPPRPRINGEGYSIYFYDYDNNLFELHTGTLEERLATYEVVDNMGD
ncbi:FosX/FosE/FosI family fosfomycin resistance hydrolase [Caldibacillus lycopersici]|uniref:FosX/FosE/FosI family fosfomycin resistance hydrolase n=1 Tax=Perspicuibacillus lycopersici TaxID=1325689 RepID=A0AAE3IRG7_9BACI|nr:FosX/FosE/FosI family fosfomycin resistance hydrolase [Perspicuibacillus lycopersici]MCU9613238.1 FosX/FosE/FosI family fosfomycin resistance hydrolase [Perspicuibacillus lycopersici]